LYHFNKHKLGCDIKNDSIGLSESELEFFIRLLVFFYESDSNSTQKPLTPCDSATLLAGMQKKKYHLKMYWYVTLYWKCQQSLSSKPLHLTWVKHLLATTKCLYQTVIEYRSLMCGKNSTQNCYNVIFDFDQRSYLICHAKMFSIFAFHLWSDQLLDETVTHRFSVFHHWWQSPNYLKQRSRRLTKNVLQTQQ